MLKRRTVPDALERYRVGAKIRRLRLRKKISLVELGRHTSLSSALLSKLERGLVTPTLPTLVRIALVFGIGLDEFFLADRPGAVVIRAAERLRFPEVQDAERSAYEFESLDFAASGRQMNAYLAEFRQPRGARVHAHEAAEFLYVMSGALIVQVDGVEHRLTAGDSMYINPSVPHGYARDSDACCKALVVTTAAPGAAAYG